MTDAQMVLDTELISGLDVDDAYRRAVRALRCGEVSMHVAGFYLADMADRGSFRAKGPGSLRHLITTQEKVKWKTVQNHIAIARALRKLPVIYERFRLGRLTYSQVREIAPIATAQTDSAWADYAEKHSLRELEAQVATRERGQLPSEEGRRRIHEPRFKVGDTFVATQYEQIRRAKAKLAAMTGQTINDGGLILFAVQLVLTMRPDGSVPGFRQVNDRHYIVHAWSPDGTPALVTTGADGKPVPLDPDGLTARLERIPFSGELKIQGRTIDLAELDSENAGPEVPWAQRDIKTPDELRDKILLRDGYQCRFCQSKRNVQVHHRVWRRFGGKTVPSNLVTVCETCHSQIHALLLFIRSGDCSGELTFVDRAGRPFVREPAQPASWSPTYASTGPGTLAGAAEHVDLNSLPAVVDPDWWARHEHLLSWSERQGELVLTPGEPREPRAPHATPATASCAVTSSTEHAEDAPHHPTPANSGLVSLFGQSRVREQLELAIAGAQQRAETLKHMVFTGEPGLGKTALARAVAVDLAAPLTELAAPHVRSPEQAVRALVSLERGGVLFLDEIHALPSRAAEVLYEALDRGTLTLPIREGLRSRTLQLRLNPFTLIGATTDEHLLPRALLSRLRVHQLEPYELEELSALLRQAARARGLELTPDAAERVAQASRDTPRRALALLDMVHDEATVAGAATADLALVECALDRAGVDAAGLDRVDRQYLRVLGKARRPMGLKTLASRLHVNVEVLRSIHEPHLVRRGFVQITREGRVLGDQRPTEGRPRAAEPNAHEGGSSALTVG